MKRFFLLPLLVYGPALANDRAESEAKLAALSDQVIVALGTVLPKVDGLTCQPGDQDKNPTSRMLGPNWRANCSWGAGGANEKATMVVILSPSGVTLQRTMFGRNQKVWADGKVPKGYAQLFGQPEPVVMLTSRNLTAVPSDSIMIMAQVPGNGVSAPPEPIVALAEAVAVMDISGVEDLAEVQAYRSALAAHRGILEQHRAALATILMAAVVGEPPTDLSLVPDYPDFMFFGAEPAVQTTVEKHGVGMVVILTTSSVALETEAKSARFADDVVDGEVRDGAVYHDRGRVRVSLDEISLSALIDGRAILNVYAHDVAEGADAVAAMEAVLDDIAANDFSDY